MASSTSRSGSRSPISHDDLLGHTSVYSEDYQAHVKKAVKRVIRRLAARGRLAESRAMRALCAQSFKDPGSRMLLDAILRDRVDDRQKSDFKTYARSIWAIEAQNAIVESDEDSGDLSPDQSETRVGSESNVPLTRRDELAASSINREPRQFLHLPDSTSGGEGDPMTKMASDLSDRPEENTWTNVGNTRKRRVPAKHKKRSIFRDETAARPQLDVGKPKRIMSRRRSKTGSSTVRMSTPRDLAADIRVSLSHLPIAQVKLSEQPPSRRRQRKMFHGANGPVYTLDVLRLKEPRPKRQGV